MVRTDLREEEEEDSDEGEDGDEAAGEGAAVEVLVHLRVGVEAPQLVPQLHLSRSHRQRDRRSPRMRGDLRCRQWGRVFLQFVWEYRGLISLCEDLSGFVIRVVLLPAASWGSPRVVG